MSQHELIDLERSAWKALSTSGDAAAEFYDGVLAKDVLMLLPGGMTIDDRATVVDSMKQADWTSFELSDERVLDLTRRQCGRGLPGQGRATRRRATTPSSTAPTSARRRLEAGAAPADAGLTDRHPAEAGYRWARSASTLRQSSAHSRMMSATGLISSMRPATWPESATAASMSPPK